jgi:hypothetical protein
MLLKLTFYPQIFALSVSIMASKQVKVVVRGANKPNKVSEEISLTIKMEIIKGLKYDNNPKTDAWP